MSKNHLQNFFISKYQSLGRIIGKYPLYFLLLPLLFSIVMASFIYKMEFSRDPFYLFSPINGQWSKDKDAIIRLFPMDADGYDPSRAIDDDNFILFQIIAKDGLSILRENVFEEIVQFNKIITNWNVNYEGKNWTYNQLCSKYNKQCPPNYGLLLDKKIKKFREGKFKVVYPIEIDLKKFKVIPWFYNLGGVTTDESGHALDALAFRLVYTLSIKDEKQVICKEWETTLQQHLKGIAFQEIIIEPVGLSTFETEMKIFISSSLPLVIYSLLCTVLFAVVSCMTNDWVRSKPWLGVSSCISALLSVASTFGFLTILKVESADITIVLPFLILGMGIDDSFVLISAWRRSNVKKSVEERMGESYSEAAVSITITSLTSCLSFCIGIITNLPIVRIFCIFASVAIFFTYIYQITFFGACMALSGYREEKRIHSLLCCKRLQNEKESSDSHTEKDSILKFFEDKIGELLMKTWIKTLIVISYFLVLLLSIWALSQLKEGVSVKRVVPKNSNLNKFFDIHYKYFPKYSLRIHVVINAPLNYADPNVQKDLQELIATFEQNPYITNVTEAWFDVYKMATELSLSKHYFDRFNLSVKEEYIDALRQIVLKFPFTKNYENDIAFNENYTEIVASRFFLLADEIQSGPDERNFLINMKKIAKNSKIPIIVYCIPFPFFEQMIETKFITIQTICIAACAMMVVFFIIISNPLCCFCVTIVIITVQVETIGLMAFWDISLDLFSLIVLIMCVGFSVNYPSHITYAYITTDSNDKKQRLKNSLYAVGMPIVQGSVSTILGIVILAFDSSYMMLVFVKITLLIILITAFHSFLFLPVMLNTFDGLFSKMFNKKKISITKKSEIDSRNHQNISNDMHNKSFSLNIVK